MRFVPGRRGRVQPILTRPIHSGEIADDAAACRECASAAAELRRTLRDGDLVFARSTGAIGFLIETLDRGPWTHCGLYDAGNVVHTAEFDVRADPLEHFLHHYPSGIGFARLDQTRVPPMELANATRWAKQVADYGRDDCGYRAIVQPYNSADLGLAAGLLLRARLRDLGLVPAARRVSRRGRRAVEWWAAREHRSAQRILDRLLPESGQRIARDEPTAPSEEALWRMTETAIRRRSALWIGLTADDAPPERLSADRWTCAGLVFEAFSSVGVDLQPVFPGSIQRAEHLVFDASPQTSLADLPAAAVVEVSMTKRLRAVAHTAAARSWAPAATRLNRALAGAQFLFDAVPQLRHSLTRTPMTVSEAVGPNALWRSPLVSQRWTATRAHQRIYIRRQRLLRGVRRGS